MSYVTRTGPSDNTRQRERGRVRTYAAITVLALLGLLLVGAGPGDASIHHTPAPAALAGTDHELLVAVESDCSLFCASSVLTVTYETDGQMRRIIRPLARWQPWQVINVRLPGQHLHGDELRYWMTTTQLRCDPFDNCRSTGHRHPTAGAHHVPLITPGTRRVRNLARLVPS